MREPVQAINQFRQAHGLAQVVVCSRLQEYEAMGEKLRLETAVILRVRSAKIIETMRTNPKTRDYIGESLGELAVTIRREHWDDLLNATAQLGLFLDADV